MGDPGQALQLQAAAHQVAHGSAGSSSVCSLFRVPFRWKRGSREGFCLGQMKTRSVPSHGPCPTALLGFLGRGLLPGPHSLFPGGQRSRVPKHCQGSPGAPESPAVFIIAPIQGLPCAEDKESPRP